MLNKQGNRREEKSKKYYNPDLFGDYLLHALKGLAIHELPRDSSRGIESLPNPCSSEN